MVLEADLKDATLSPLELAIHERVTATYLEARERGTNGLWVRFWAPCVTIRTFEKRYKPILDSKVERFVVNTMIQYSEVMLLGWSQEPLLSKGLVASVM